MTYLQSYLRNRRARLKAQGRCVDCGYRKLRLLDSGHVLCAKCRESQRNRYHAVYSLKTGRGTV